MNPSTNTTCLEIGRSKIRSRPVHCHLSLGNWHAGLRRIPPKNNRECKKESPTAAGPHYARIFGKSAWQLFRRDNPLRSLTRGTCARLTGHTCSSRREHPPLTRHLQLPCTYSRKPNRDKQDQATTAANGSRGPKLPWMLLR